MLFRVLEQRFEQIITILVEEFLSAVNDLENDVYRGGFAMEFRPILLSHMQVPPIYSVGAVTVRILNVCKTHLLG